MLASTEEIKTLSPEMLVLGGAGHDDPRTLDWLVIADDDPKILTQLKPMLESKSAAMVSVAQWQWDFSQPDWQQTVGWAVGEAGVSHLLLVGHSQSVAEQAASGHESSDTGIARRPISGSRSVNGFATERLFNGAKQVQLQLRQARQHYSEQVAAACQVPPVAESLQQGKLQLHTLFYMAQTNAFHHFDVKNGQFRPLS